MRSLLHHSLILLIYILSLWQPLSLLKAEEKSSSADWILLRTVAGKKTEITGNTNLLHRPLPPASTFKIIIAWAALEEGIVKPDTIKTCNDPYISKEPVQLNLQQALFYSSNDYFAQLAQELGKERLEKYLSKSDLLGDSPIPKNWLKNGLTSAVHGGELLVTPYEQHQLILKIRSGKLTSNRTVQAELLSAMYWDAFLSDNYTLFTYGKTGTAKGVAWFNGFSTINLNNHSINHPKLPDFVWDKFIEEHEVAVTYVTFYDTKKTNDWKRARRLAIESAYKAFHTEPPKAAFEPFQASLHKADSK